MLDISSIKMSLQNYLKTRQENEAGAAIDISSTWVVDNNYAWLVMYFIVNKYMTLAEAVNAAGMADKKGILYVSEQDAVYEVLMHIWDAGDLSQSCAYELTKYIRLSDIIHRCDDNICVARNDDGYMVFD